METDDFGDFESADFNALWSSAPADGVESGGTGPCSSNESMTVGSAELTNGHNMFGEFGAHTDCACAIANVPLRTKESI